MFAVGPLANSRVVNLSFAKILPVHGKRNLGRLCQAPATPYHAAVPIPAALREIIAHVHLHVSHRVLCGTAAQTCTKENQTLRYAVTEDLSAIDTCQQRASHVNLTPNSPT